jgi:hypothetical protein
LSSEGLTINQKLTPEVIGRAIDKVTLNRALMFIIAVAAVGFSSIPLISSSFRTRCR